MWVNKGALFLAKFIFLVPKCTKIHQLTGFLELTFSHMEEAPMKLLSPPPPLPLSFKPPHFLNNLDCKTSCTLIWYGLFKCWTKSNLF